MIFFPPPPPHTRVPNLRYVTKKAQKNPPYFKSYFIYLIADFNWQDVSIEQLSVWEGSVSVRTLWISFDVNSMIIGGGGEMWWYLGRDSKTDF